MLSVLTDLVVVLVLWCDAFVVFVLPDEPKQNQRRGLVDRKLIKAPPPSNYIAGRSKAALLFCSMVILDVVCRYLSLFLLYISMKIGKNTM